MIYWLILVLIIISIFFKRGNSQFYLNIAIYVFIGGAILRLINLNYLAEILLRVDFILWLAGFVLVIKEDKYKNEI